MEELFGYDSMNDEQSLWKTKNTQSKKIENLTKQNRSKQKQKQYYLFVH